MSCRIVERVIDSLLSDKDLQVRFAIDPIEALADLNLRGFELTEEEIGMFVRTDARIWFGSDELVDVRIQ